MTSSFLSDLSLDLFLFHLKEGLGEGKEKIDENCATFWSNLPSEVAVSADGESQASSTEYLKLLSTIIKASANEESKAGSTEYLKLLTAIAQASADEELQDSSTEYLKLLTATSKDNTVPLVADPLEGKPLSGYYYPVLINDTYGLLIDCCFADATLNVPVSYLQDFKKAIGDKQGDLGKVWMISGYRDRAASPEKIAQSAYNKLVGKDWQRVQIGKFLGAEVFAVFSVAEPPVLIFIYPDRDRMNQATKFYDAWLRLFCYYSKINWSYREARQCSRGLQSSLGGINQTIQAINRSDFDAIALKKNIKKSADYIVQLSQLEIIRQAIETNIINYRHCLERIQSRAEKIDATDLKFLQEFTTTATEKYQAQIIRDCESFQSGLAVVRSLRETIAALASLEQAERDRHLENLIASVGIGVGTASAAASSAANFAEEIATTSPLNQVPLPQPWRNFSTAFSISLVVGFLCSAIAWRILACWRPKK